MAGPGAQPEEVRGPAEIRADAARVAHEARAGLAVPCHYDMFEFNTASPAQFVEECGLLGQPQRVLLAGERLTLLGRSERSSALP